MFKIRIALLLEALFVYSSSSQNETNWILLMDAEYEKEIKWNALMDELQNQMQTKRTMREVIEFIPFVTTQIIGDDIWMMTEHQASVSELWTNTLKHALFGTDDEMTQPVLTEIVQLMMQQNVPIRIDLSVDVWNTYFAIYYFIKNELGDEALFSAVDLMKMNGSRTLPNSRTFEIVLVGIASNKRVKDPIKLSQIVIDELMKDYGITPSLPHFISAMLICMDAKNVTVATQWILDYALLLNDEYLCRFYLNAFAEADIDEINSVLQQLLDSRSIAVEQLVKFLIEFVVSSDRESIAFPCYKTYSLLRQLCLRQCGQHILREFVCKWPVRHLS